MGGSAVFLHSVLCLGQQRNLNSKPQEFRAPPTKNILYGAMLGAMCGMYGGKRVGETLAWEEVLSFYIQFVLGPAKEFKLKTSRVWSRAMLGAMCGMYGGKRVGETLAWEEVLSFYIQFVLGPAKEFKLKTSRVSSPTHKKHFVC